MMNKNSEMYFLNVLRVVGALIIAICLHYHWHLLDYMLIENPYIDSKIGRFLFIDSHVFVEMFFSISGMLFWCVYRERIDGGMNLDLFIGGRVFRIYPEMLTTIVVMIFGNVIFFFQTRQMYYVPGLNGSWIAEEAIFGGKTLFSSVRNINGAVWYIGILMACYFVAYFIEKFSCKMEEGVALYFIPVFLGIWMINSKDFGNVYLARGLVAFFIGVFIGYALGVLDNADKRLRRMVCGVATIIICCSVPIYYIGSVGDLNIFFDFWVWPELIILGYYGKALNRIGKSILFRRLSELSFSIYLWNIPIYMLVCIFYNCGVRFKVTSLGFFVFILLMNLVVAYVFHKLVRSITSYIKSWRTV